MALTLNTSTSPSDRDFSGDARAILERIATVSPSVVYVFNTQTRIGEYTSGSVARLIGYTPEQVQDMGDQFMIHLCHPEDLPRFGEHMARMGNLPPNDSGEKIERFEYRMKHANGDWRWFMSNDRVLERDADGNVLRLIGAATDINEAKQAEAQAILQKDAAERLNDKIRAFTFSMAHDLRAPVNTLQLLLSELQRLPTLKEDSEATELLGDSFEVASGMQNLLAGLNENIQAATARLDWEETNLNDLLNAALLDLRSAIETSNATVEIKVDALPTLSCSAQHLQIVLQNLIENAIKYAGRDRAPRIQIFAQPDIETSVAKICVRDNGPGIPDHHQERIFNAFERLGPKSSRGSSGLGLTISRHIVELHGGALNVNPIHTDGAEFVLSLPQH